MRLPANTNTLDFRAIAVHRNRETFIPRGEGRFEENDLSYVITKPEAINNLLSMGESAPRHSQCNGCRRRTCWSNDCQTARKDMNIKLIEKDKERQLYISNRLS